VTPARTGGDRVQRGVACILEDPDVDARALRAKGHTPVATAPDAFAEYTLRELADRAVVVKLCGAKLE